MLFSFGSVNFYFNSLTFYSFIAALYFYFTISPRCKLNAGIVRLYLLKSIINQIIQLFYNIQLELILDFEHNR